MGKYFGTDGVRGRANDTLTPELAFRLGRAAAAVLSRGRSDAAGESKPLFVVGKDTRISGTMLEAALSAGIAASGCNVLLLGVLPTPGVAALTRRLGAEAGVVISASHNPYYDNGVKFFSASGYKFPDAVEDEIEAMMDSEESIPRALDGDLGEINSYPSAITEYLDWLHRQFKPDLTGCKLVVDAANGAASPLAEDVFSRLGAEVVMLSASPDGVNINQQCGSTHLSGLQRRVTAEGAMLGLALDGDADRLLAVDESGMLVDGDQILAVLARYLLSHDKLAGRRAVVTQMSNLGFLRAMEELGVQVEITQVGDRYVLERMLETGAVLGGEQSGHIILSDYNTTGDGLLAGLMLTAVLVESGQSLSQLASLMRRLPQVLVNVPVRTKQGWQENADILAAKSKAEAALSGRGRLLLRPSGTEQMIRVMAEGEDEEELRSIVDQVAEAVRGALGR